MCPEQLIGTVTIPTDQSPSRLPVVRDMLYEVAEATIASEEDEEVDDDTRDV